MDRREALTQGLADKNNLGTYAGVGAGALALAQMLRSWDRSQATFLAKKGLPVKRFPAPLVLAGGGLLGVLAKTAYDAYKDRQGYNYY